MVETLQGTLAPRELPDVDGLDLTGVYRPAGDGREPGEVLRRLDQLLDHHETTRFCTAVLVRLRRTAAGWSATYASGGHPPLVVRSDRAAEVRRTRLVRASGQLLGGPPTGDFEQLEVPLVPGDSVFLYTDGVTESRSDRDLYGDAPAARRGRWCRSRLVGHRRGRARRRDPVRRRRARDDIACLAVTGQQRR